MGIIRGIFSIEEAKVSTIMISFIAFSATGIILLFKTGNIPSPLAYIIISLAGFIVGANVAPSLMSMMGQSSIYGGSYGGMYGGSSYGGMYGGSYNTTGVNGYNTNTITQPTQSTTTTSNTVTPTQSKTTITSPV